MQMRFSMFFIIAHNVAYPHSITIFVQRWQSKPHGPSSYNRVPRTSITHRAGCYSGQEVILMAQPIALILEATLKPGQQQAFQALMTELIASAQGEPGTLSYEFFGSDDGTVALAYERYADSAAA